MKGKLLEKVEYKYGEGFAVSIVKPTKDMYQADIVELTTFRNRDGEGYKHYYTPDEAMSVARLLLLAVDKVTTKHWMEFRKSREDK